MPSGRSELDDRVLEAARLYLYGPPYIRDNWDASCKKAGYERTPPLDARKSQDALAQVRTEPPPGVEEDLAELEKLLSGDGDVSWEEMAPIARKFLGKIGAGHVQANQGQIQSLKEIIARAEGRIGAQVQDDAPLGVVVLPAQVESGTLPYVDAEPGESIGERHNRLARREAKREEWKEKRTIPGGGYRDEEYGGPSRSGGQSAG